MFEFPEGLRIPLAGWVDSAMDWILSNLGGVFDWIGGWSSSRGSSSSLRSDYSRGG
ncbi:MAG: hypothetical protein ACOCZB_03690 [Spirochaetota bacterium]